MYSIKLPRKNNHTDGKKGILGISLKREYRFYENKNDLQKIIKEIEKLKFSVCYIVIADGELYLNSLLSNHPNGDINIMRTRAFQAGKDWRKKFEIDKLVLNTKTRMVILHWEEVVQNSKKFKNNEDMLMINNLMESDKDMVFKQSVDKMANLFIERNNGKSDSVVNMDKVKYSKNYICLEQAGLFSFAKREGIDFFIYPGKEFQPFSILRRNYFDGKVLNWCGLYKNNMCKNHYVFHNLRNLSQVKKKLTQLNDRELIRVGDMKCIIDIVNQSHEAKYEEVNNKVDNLTKMTYGVLFLFILIAGLLMIQNKYSNNVNAPEDENNFNFNTTFGSHP